MTADWPIRLRVEMEGENRAHLLSRIEMQAKQFFGELPYRLQGDVEVSVEEDVQTVAGKSVMQVWAGTAYFETLP